MTLSRSPSDARFEALFAKRPDMIKPGLTRVERGAAALGREGFDIPCVLVGGTNGKGSTTGYLWRMISLAGTRAGLFTSPHLVCFSERFRVSGRPFDDDAAEALLAAVRRDLSPALYEDLSFFEVATLMGARLFAREACRFAVYEVGMGGRWDATNITDPAASAIVSVGMDHTRYLGSTIEAIAGEKAGIIREGRPVFCGIAVDAPFGSADATAMGVIRAEADRKRAPLWLAGREFGARFGGRFWIDLPGGPRFEGAIPESIRAAAAGSEDVSFLERNFALAAAMYGWLAREGMVGESLERVLARFDTTDGVGANDWAPSLWGRLQRCVIQGPNGCRTVMLDVGHNVDGARALVATVSREGGGRRPGMVSILADKDVNGVIDLLRGILDPVVLFRIENERSFRREDLDPRHRGLPMYPDFDQAWREVASRWSWDDDAPLVVCGSVAAVGEVMRYFELGGTCRVEGAPSAAMGRSPCAWGLLHGSRG